jgi:hypothetical protein
LIGRLLAGVRGTLSKLAVPERGRGQLKLHFRSPNMAGVRGTLPKLAVPERGRGHARCRQK